ncbi:MAG: hypothetical protein ABWY45_05455 [Mycobacterium sp.]
MAMISSDRTIVRSQQRDDKSWLFTISYTAFFSESDLGKRFDDAVAIRELHGQSRIAEEHSVSFTASSPRMLRKKRIVVRGAAIEAVCAQISLHRSAVQSLRF